MNQNTIELIAMLIALATAICTALVFIRKWYLRKYRSLVLRVTNLKMPSIHIGSLDLDLKDEKMSVSSLLCWKCIEVYNNDASPIVIKNFLAFEEGAPPREIFIPPYKSLIEVDKGLQLKGCIEVPYSMAGHSGIKVWILLELSIPINLGKLIYEFCSNTLKNTIDIKNYKQSVKALSDDIREEFFKLKSPYLKEYGINIVDAGVTGFAPIRHPIPQVFPDQFIFESFWGDIPSGLKNTLIIHLSSFDKLSHLSYVRHKHFLLELVLSDEKRIIKKIDVKNDALWFC